MGGRHIALLDKWRTMKLQKPLLQLLESWKENEGSSLWRTWQEGMERSSKP